MMGGRFGGKTLDFKRAVDFVGRHMQTTERATPRRLERADYIFG
jgi:hypothetical protein